MLSSVGDVLCYRTFCLNRTAKLEELRWLCLSRERERGRVLEAGGRRREEREKKKEKRKEKEKNKK